MIDDTSTLPKRLLRRIRWVIIVLLVVSLAVLLGFKTKKTIAGPITLTSLQKPVYCYATQAGLFIPLVKDTSTIEKGDYLGYLEGDYLIDDYLAFAQLVQEYPNSVPPKNVIQQLGVRRLGSLNNLLLLLHQAQEELLYHQTDQKQKLNQAAANYRRKFTTLQDQLSVYDNSDSLNLVLNELNKNIEERMRYLSQEKLIAPQDLEETRSGFLQDYLTLNVQLDLRKRDILLSLLQEEGKWLEAQQNYTTKLYQLQQEVANQWLQIKRQATQFEKENLLKAPAGGKCYFEDFVINSNINYAFYVAPDQAFAKIEPLAQDQIIGLLDISSGNLAKVTRGRPVRIKLDAYPFLEFGVVFGEVASVSNIPFADKHHVVVDLPDTLVSSYNEPINYYPEMKGEAEIVLEESNLLLKITQAFRWYRQS